MTKHDPYMQVWEFMDTFGQAVQTKPDSKLPYRKLREELIREEFVDELIPAMDNYDLVEVADALGDLVYVIYGAALAWGIPLDEVVTEIHRSNMSKLHHQTGEPIYRADGKVLKGENYSPPNIRAILECREPDCTEYREDYHGYCMNHYRTITNIEID